ncbi:UPF0146 family protein [Halovivax limisalsi]|uniref:UPF0146 family protein n=1 Tax=Halovivax limisalsi TaxID=1453760 RepID=UPI001FFC4D04|nr:UPF0146 family protein [Halovivax limisalsi]
MPPDAGDSGTDRRADAELVAVLSRYDRVVEVGIGRRPDVAAALAARGVDVTATDVHERAVPDGVRFVRDDVVDPDSSIYADAAAIYALNLPPELHRPLAALADRVGADALFTTLGADRPQVPVERRSLDSQPLFVREGADPPPG